MLLLWVLKLTVRLRLLLWRQRRLLSWAFIAVRLLKDITAVAGGRGGGKPDMAQGGGSDASKIDDALAKVDEIVAEQIK